MTAPDSAQPTQASDAPLPLTRISLRAAAKSAPPRTKGLSIVAVDPKALDALEAELKAAREALGRVEQACFDAMEDDRASGANCGACFVEIDVATVRAAIRGASS